MHGYLIKTKLNIPVDRMSAIARPGLVKRLDEGLDLNRRLSLISAPPGYGKTSLAVEWAGEGGMDFAWFTIDKSDNEPIRFFMYIIAALQKHDEGIGIAAQSLLDAPQFPPMDILVGALINDIADTGRKIVLVLDDCHQIHNEALNEALGYLIANQPLNLHIVIIGREDPKIPLSRYRAGGLITEIREEDLRFSHEETLEFMRKTMNLNLSEGQVSLLETRTEGWAAGLQLAAFSIRGREGEELSRFISDFGGTERYIGDYLFEEVFRQLPEDMKDFLTETSVLDRFNSRLCDVLTGKDGSTRMIERILKSHVFIVQMDDRGGWYRYHNLFREMLLSALSAEKKALLHASAVKWFEDNGLFEEAIKYASASNLFCDMERLICKTAWDMIQRGEISTLYGWICELPGDVIERNQEIRMYKAWCLLLTGNGREAAPLISSIDMAGVVKDRPDIKANLLILQIYRSINVREISALNLAEQVETFIGSGDDGCQAAALYCAAQVKSLKGLLEESIRCYSLAFNTALKTNQYFIALVSLKNLAVSLLLTGRKREAIDVCADGLNRLVDGKGKLLPGAALIFIPLGMAYYSEDNLPKAEECLQKGITVCRQLELIHFAVQGEMSLAQLKYAMGDYTGAVKTIHESCRTLEEIGMSVGIPMFMAVEAELHLRQGDLETAKKWAQEAGLSSCNAANHLDERQYLTYVRVLTACGSLEDAGMLLKGLESSAKDGERIYRLITIYILESIVFMKQRREDEALSALGNAVKLAAPEDFYRLFLDEDHCTAGLLGGLKNKEPVFVQNLSKKFEAQPRFLEGGTVKGTPGRGNAEISKDGITESLSDREMEVLDLMAQGLSNQEIADSLYISLATAKWHITNIFSKLGAKNRIQAVEAAKSIVRK